MKLVSFNMFRTLGLSETGQVDLSYIKPEDFDNNPGRFREQLDNADWILFPEYWQLNALEYVASCRIFPSTPTYRIGHNKIEMTRACRLLAHENLPATWISRNTPEEAERLWQEMDRPFVAKLTKASQGVGVWLINDRRDWQQYLARADHLYLQEYLPINRDLRIVLVGEQIVAAYWRHQSDRTFHTNVSQGGHVSYDDIPEQALALVKRLAASLNIDHAGFDIAMVGDHPYLLEFNRLFGNQGIPGGGKTITAAMLGYLRDMEEDDDRPVDPDRPRPFHFPLVS